MHHNTMRTVTQKIPLTCLCYLISAQRFWNLHFAIIFITSKSLVCCPVLYTGCLSNKYQWLSWLSRCHYWQFKSFLRHVIARSSTSDDICIMVYKTANRWLSRPLTQFQLPYAVFSEMDVERLVRCDGHSTVICSVDVQCTVGELLLILVFYGNNCPSHIIPEIQLLTHCLNDHTLLLLKWCQGRHEKIRPVPTACTD